MSDMHKTVSNNPPAAPSKRLRWYVTAISSAFAGIGSAGFFVSFPLDVTLGNAHNIIHLIAGTVGFLSFNHPRAFAKWLGIGAVAFSVAGLLGLRSVLGLIDLTTYFTYFYALVGVVSLLMYLDDTSRKA